MVMPQPMMMGQPVMMPQQQPMMMAPQQQPMMMAPQPGMVQPGMIAQPQPNPYFISY